MGMLYILGSGTPTPTKTRFGSSYVLNLQNDYLMFDCGPATTYKLVKVGLFPTQIDYLFFTHHHSDHNSDYPCFLLCRWDQSIGREKQLKVYGPPPTEWITKHIIGKGGVFSHDLQARIEHPKSRHVHTKRGGSLPRASPSLYVADVCPGKIVEQEKKWSVTATLTKHVEPYLVSLAYRLDSNEGSIVFTGDTDPCESIDKLSYGVDIIVANTSWGLLDTISSAKLAQESGAKKLILTHIDHKLSMLDSKKKVLKEIAKIYTGETIISNELMKIPIW